jgi:hypothetical protein
MEYWKPHKFYPRDFASKKDEFLYWLKSDGATTKHLQLLLKAYPNHKCKNEIIEELRRRNANKV